MIRIPALQLALLGLVGFRQHVNPEVARYAEDVTLCGSGIYVDGIAPLIQPDRLIAALPKINPSAYAEYNATVAYAPGSVVRLAAKLYRTPQRTAAGQHPSAAPWKETDPVSLALRNALDDAAAHVANAIMREKISDGNRGRLGETNLYGGAGNTQDLLVKNRRFCGLEIVVKDGRDVAVRIQQLGLQVNTANPSLDIYVYHSSQLAPVAVVKPGFAGGGMFSWGKVDQLLTVLDKPYAPGGSFFIGYYEDDLAGQVVFRQKDWTNAVLMSCGTCNPYDKAAFLSWSEWVEIHPLSVPFARLNTDKTLWNTDFNEYNYESNFGLNLTLAVECDPTQYFSRNGSLLADAIAKQAAVNVLQLFATSTENNALAEQCRQVARAQLDNRENYTPGYVALAKEAIKAAALNFSDSNSPCLAGAAQRRIRHSAM